MVRVRQRSGGGAEPADWEGSGATLTGRGMESFKASRKPKYTYLIARASIVGGVAGWSAAARALVSTCRGQGGRETAGGRA